MNAKNLIKNFVEAWWELRKSIRAGAMIQLPHELSSESEITLSIGRVVNVTLDRPAMVCDVCSGGPPNDEWRVVAIQPRVLIAGIQDGDGKWVVCPGCIQCLDAWDGSQAGLMTSGLLPRVVAGLNGPTPPLSNLIQ